MEKEEELYVNLSCWQVNKVVRQEIRNAVKDLVTKVKMEDIADAVAAQVVTRIGWSHRCVNEDEKISAMLDKRIGEMIHNISDDFIRNALTQRLLDTAV